VIEILRRMFKANPEKSTIILKEKCSDCEQEISIEITPTSGGFGIMGGALYKSLYGKFIVKCSSCIGANPKTYDNRKSGT